MRTAIIVLVVGLLFAIYGFINFYVYIRGLQSIPPGSTLRNAYAIVFWVAALSLIAGRVLERYWISPLSDLLVWAGSFWIGALVYFLVAAVTLDLIRLVNHFLPFFPSFITANYSQVKYAACAGTIAAVACLLIAGHINAVMTRLVTLDLKLGKSVEGMKTINIVAASDIHLGTIVGRNRFDRIVETVNRLDPDVVLLPGDIVDEDLGPVIKQNLGESLRNIRSRFGVFAVTGNHEYIGGVEKACTYLTEHGVVMLRDRAVKVNGSFFLVGREDRSLNGYRGKKRKSLAELMQNVDKACPVILMDHQPFQLEEAAGQGIDVQVSGHTHHGQLWPVNYIIKAIYEVGWGYKRIAGMHVIVSNGVGTWGPPVRIGNRPEILNIRLRMQ
jgi:hypothetical protein